MSWHWASHNFESVKVPPCTQAAIKPQRSYHGMSSGRVCSLELITLINLDHRLWSELWGREGHTLCRHVSASLNRNKATQVRGYSKIFKVLSTTAYHSYNTVGARPQSAQCAKRMNTSNQSHDYRELCSAHWCIVFLCSTGTLQKVATNVTAGTIIKGRAMKRYHKIVSWNSLEYFSW